MKQVQALSVRRRWLYNYLMSKNPVINALGALAYIGLVVAVMTFLSNTMRNKPDTIGAPLTVLSLFTLSAAVMGYLFLYQPLMLFIDGKKKHAVTLFVQTVGVFAVFTAIILILLFSGLI